MAAGSANPIVPSPPDVRKVRVRRTGQDWAAHIWCCPTSTVTIVSFGEAAARAC